MTTQLTPGYYYHATIDEKGHYTTTIVNVREDGTRCMGFNGEPFPQDKPLHRWRDEAIQAARQAWHEKQNGTRAA